MLAVGSAELWFIKQTEEFPVYTIHNITEPIKVEKMFGLVWVGHTKALASSSSKPLVSVEIELRFPPPLWYINFQTETSANAWKAALPTKTTAFVDESSSPIGYTETANKSVFIGYTAGGAVATVLFLFIYIAITCPCWGNGKSGSKSSSTAGYEPVREGT